MKSKEYEAILQTMGPLIEGLDYPVAALSNASALLNLEMSNLNWVGFYILKDGVLKLGPFQGKPACTIIPVGKGVCGACAKEQKSIIVPNVHDFKGHIACDSASMSEICVPMFKDGVFYGLLDIDAPIPNRFEEIDREYLEQIVHIIEKEI